MSDTRNRSTSPTSLLPLSFSLPHVDDLYEILRCNLFANSWKSPPAPPQAPLTLRSEWNNGFSIAEKGTPKSQPPDGAYFKAVDFSIEHSCRAMSIKRPRAAYEADPQVQQSPFVAYGTPLPPLDPNVRDDGSFVPIWKQEVTDERGRKRLHGAFTGGFSAGYFNTVGSKEGWTPSTFVSSRSNRKRDESKATQQRPEDFMDDEDLADATEGQKVQTTDDFAGIGSTDGDPVRRGVLIDLFRTDGETMGVKLLKKMGWREGQGVGPKIRRKARLGVGETSNSSAETDTHLFAPENTHMISFVRKNDHKGLGYEGEEKLDGRKLGSSSNKLDDDEQTFGTSAKVSRVSKKKSKSGGIGIGILNDTGSDDENPYEIGPRMSYNKTIGGDKKKKKPVANGAVRPVFISKKAAIAKASSGLIKCHDGRLPLDGFILSTDLGSLSSIIISDGKYLPPDIPEGWRSKKQSLSPKDDSKYMSTADAAKVSRLDPKARAALLGEASLPGKSVFDYLSTAARDRLASASGKTNLPAALGEALKGYSLTPEQRQKDLLNQIPKVEKDTAIAALGKGASGWMPYAEDENKRVRYRSFLETQAGITNGLPERAPGIAKNDWIKELQEFAHCAQIFKPMTGMMATRFTSSSSTLKLASDTLVSEADSLLSKPAPKAEDPAEAAAKLGMFGPMTRSSEDFYPTRLLCKRFGVKPPAHVQVDPERTAGDGEGTSSASFTTGQEGRSLELLSKSAINEMLLQSGGRNQNWDAADTGPRNSTEDAEPPTAEVIDVERNEALENERAGDAVFKAIFGDSDDDDDE